MDWAQLTLFLYIAMRMTGFITLGPIFGRKNIPALVKAGYILVLSITVFSISGAMTVEVPGSVLILSLRLLLEFALGYLLGFILDLFFYLTAFAGHIIDNQMGMAMANIYDAGANISNTVTATLLNILMFLIFFAAGGHITLLRILLSSGQVVPFGQVALGPDVANAVATVFIESMVLAIKLSLPVMAAEMIVEVGMGILMKAIPQINAFVINIELKVLVGLFLVWLLMTPFTEFLVQAEATMLKTLTEVLALAV